MSASGGARQWRMRLQLLREDLRADLDSVAGLRPVARRRAIVDELLADLDRQLDRSEAAAVITLVGATGAGKSTLLNALAGQEIAREGIDRPTTSEATVYAPHDADLTSLLQRSADGGAGPKVVRYTPADGRSDAHVYVDAPDMNSVEEVHAERLRDLALRSDVLLVVLHHQSVVEAAPVEFLDSFAQRRGLAFVLNRTDELTDEARDALLAQIRRLAADRWGAADAPVIGLSAWRARSQPQGPDRQRLVDTIAAILGGQSIQRIRRHNALGTAAMLAEVFAEVEAEIAADFAALPGDVAAGVDELAKKIADDGAERWRLHRADMNELLWAETARRWEGPGGWVLRVGGIEALGIGAAGALARTHPLLAIGTAVSAAAASGVRKVAQERRLYDNNPMLPSATDLDAAWHAALAPARIRAGRLCGDTGMLGLPDADDTRAAVGGAVDTAWRRLVDHDLPQAAERSVLRFFRWLIDLPVYALVVWLVYRAGMGFVDGSYVGVDLLVNSALLAGAYLVAVRLTVRAGLRRRARRLLAAAAEASRAGLDDWKSRVNDVLGARLGELAAALERLRRVDVLWQRRLGGDGVSRP
jgi:energy-coupling factor transporter ATP-binding protein EcfA2